MNTHQWTAPFSSMIASVALILFSVVGCVERVETITITKDGSVSIQLKIEGTQEELTTGDAMPTEASGWSVARRIKKEKDKEKLVLKTSRAFAPGESLPQSFADEDDPDADLYLEFPTSLRIESRSDGVYYYFRRIYTPRRWSYVEHWRDMIFDDEIEQISEKPVEEITRADKLQLIEAFAGLEAFKQLEFASQAMSEQFSELPVEFGLMARQAVLDFYGKELNAFESILDLCDPMDGDQQDACFEAEADRVLSAGYETYLEVLRSEAGFNQRQINQFQQANARAKRYYELTDQLGSHGFEITVKMPGTIIAHNAEELNRGKKGQPDSVKFQFQGEAFRDRSQELLVVSRVDLQGPGR